MLTPKVISAQGLAPLATLLRSDGNRRTEFAAAVEPGEGPGGVALAVIRFDPPAEARLVVDRMERHPHSAQTFVPISVDRFYVVVAPAGVDGSPDMAQARAFVAGMGDAIIYPRNVWHASLLVSGRPAEMAVIMWRREAGDDTIAVKLDAPLTLGG